MFWICHLMLLAALATTYAQKTGNVQFSCSGRTTGYYADVSSGCQVYHMCDGLGRQFTYTCPNATLFQQRMLICDHWYMVNCSKSEEDYSANLLIGQREKHFVEDNGIHSYNRTPRPDLLSHPSAAEFNIIYRKNAFQNLSNKTNVIGVEPSKDNKYFLPSHWSTQDNSEPKPNQQPTNMKSFFKTNYQSHTKQKANTISGFRTSSTVPTPAISTNYKSYFKNTTPVFPKTVDVTTTSPEDFGLEAPIPFIDKPSPDKPQSVNFQSNFKATTPVYPKFVAPTSPEPFDVGLEPPQGPQKQNSNSNVPMLNLNIEAPKETNERHPFEEATASPPSMFYEPPKFEPDFQSSTTERSSNRRADSGKVVNIADWKDLRRMFLIPDYEFPLDAAPRPNYEGGFSSFQVKVKKR